MKFIRDIISERATVDAAEPVDAFPVPPRPDVSGQPAATDPTDRTMTRLSQDVPVVDDDIFDRLLRDETEVEPIVADETRLSDLPENDTGKGNSRDDLATAPLTLRAEERVAPDIADPADLKETVAALIPPLNKDAVRGPVSAPLDRQSDMPPVDTPPLADLPVRSVAPETEVRHTEFVAVPAPATGRSGRAASRVKTRLLGFAPAEDPIRDPFRDATPVRGRADLTFPVGWLVVIAGPGRGTAFTLQTGVSQLGRGEDQAIRLDFGDTAISRSNHAAIAHDAERGGFYLGHGGKANMVRLNDRPVLSTEELPSGAVIRIGETSLRFVAFCDAGFSWSEDGADPHAPPY
ncbi:FHA domain-containing protein [Aestuariivita sp.]|jgi:hypothetical protein|uniref:FHA domain-containing protein n=1 Tax=Aestuariivita sp. TaxID=1872407 RepID=UPI0025BFE29F|nr:FHA domain-containing protein [Aestuariivita sp.]